jgi:hypothetical protein
MRDFVLGWQLPTNLTRILFFPRRFFREEMLFDFIRPFGVFFIYIRPKV